MASSVGITIAWVGVVSVSVLAFGIARAVFGLRVSGDAERAGLDISAHGETAYKR